MIYLQEFTSQHMKYEEFEGESNVKAANVNLFKKLLLKMIGVNPDEWDETFMGASYDDCCVGYHELPFNMLYVNSFFQSGMFGTKNRSTEDKYDWEDSDIEICVAKCMLDIVEKDLIWKGFQKCKDTYTKNKDKIAIGITKYMLNTNECQELATSNIYYGTYISGINEENEVQLWSRQIESEILDLFESVNSYADIKYYVSYDFVFLICEGISARLKKEKDGILKNKELANIRKGIQEYNALFPQENVLKITFDKITPDEFEVFSEVLLNEMGYYDSHLMGNTRASDGGGDIIAYKDVVGSNGIKSKEKWVIQCKRYKSGTPIKRADVADIPYILSDNKAHKYMLLSTKQLSPQVCKRIDSVNESYNQIIEDFSGAELKLLVGGYLDIVKRFELKND